MNNNQNIPEVLYKYMPLERFEKKGMDNYLAGEAYFDNYGTFNDIFEGIPKEYCLNEPDTDFFYKQLKKTLICCLADNNDNELLWAHYANKHNGVCIGYNVEPVILNKEKIELTAINYGDNYKPSLYNPLINAIGIYKNHPDEFNNKLTDPSYLKFIVWLLIKFILSHKSKEWDYEQEWRLLKPSGEKGFKKIGTVKEIFFGARCAGLEDLYDKLKKSPTWNSNIQIYNADLDIKQEKVVFRNKYTHSVYFNYHFLRQTSTVNYNITKNMGQEENDLLYFQKHDICEEVYTNLISYITKTFMVDPKFLQVLISRGKTYYQSGDYEKAIVDFAEVVRLVPSNEKYKILLKNAETLAEIKIEKKIWDGELLKINGIEKLFKAISIEHRQHPDFFMNLYKSNYEYYSKIEI
jgi:hypothetical protein